MELLLFANKSYGVCRANLWTQAVTSCPVITRRVDNHRFFSASNLTKPAETTINIFPVRSLVLYEVISIYFQGDSLCLSLCISCDAKIQKRPPLQCCLSTSAPPPICCLLYRWDILKGFQKHLHLGWNPCYSEISWLLEDPGVHIDSTVSLMSGLSCPNFGR